MRAAWLAVGVALCAGANAAAVGPPVRADVYGDPLPPGAVARLGTAKLRSFGASREQGLLSRIAPEMYDLAALDQALRACLVATDLRTGRKRAGPTLAFDLPSRPVQTALSPDGKHLLVGDTYTGKVWWIALKTGEVLKRLETSCQDVASIDIAPDNRQAVAVTAKGLELICLKTGRVRLLRETGGGWEAAAFMPGSKTIAARRQDGSATVVLDVFTGKELLRVPGGRDQVISPNGRYVATLAADLVVHDLATGKAVRCRLMIAEDERLVCLAFREDGAELVVFVPSARQAVVVRTATGTPTRRLDMEDQGFDGGSRFQLTADGRGVLILAHQQEARLWDVRSGKRRFAAPTHSLPVKLLAFSRDGRTLATVDHGLKAHTWDVATGRPLTTADLEPRLAPESRLLLTAGGRLVRVVGNRWGTIDVRSGKPVVVGVAAEGPIQSFACSPDGRSLATAGRGPTVQLWDLATGKLTGTLSRGSRREAPDWLCFRPDGRALAIGEEGLRVDIWGLRSGRLEGTLRGAAFREGSSGEGGGGEAFYSPDGRLIIADDGLLSIWSVRRGREVEPLQGELGGLYPDELTPVAGMVSFDGRFLAGHAMGGLEQPYFAVWEVASRRVVWSRPVDPLPVMRHPTLGPLAFSPVGWTFAAQEETGAVLIWDIPTLLRRQSQPGVPLPQLWRDLASTDAARAQRAVWRLAATPGAAAFLARHLAPAVPVPAARRNPALLALSSEDVRVRRRGERDLAAMGEAAHDDLLRLYFAADDLDLSLRAGRLLERCGPRSPEGLRQHRAVLALEAMGTRAARDVLMRLAAGLPNARLTREAKAALARLRR